MGTIVENLSGGNAPRYESEYYCNYTIFELEDRHIVGAGHMMHLSETISAVKIETHKLYLRQMQLNTTAIMPTFRIGSARSFRGENHSVAEFLLMSHDMTLIFL